MCGNCARLRLDCSGYATSPNALSQELAEYPRESSKGKRTYRSCKACRASKTKCSGERPTCRRCQAKEFNCIYPVSSQPEWIRRVQVITSDSQGALPTPSMIPDESPSYVSEWGPIYSSEKSHTPQSSCLSYQQPVSGESSEPPPAALS